MEPAREDLLRALGEVIDPELRRPVTELDMVRGVDVAGGDVRVTIALTVAGCPLRSSFEEQVQRTVGAVPGVERVSLAFDVMSPDERQALTTKLRGGVTERTKGISLDASTRVLAIASGKGGVGKSTVSVNLAAAFAGLGHRTGILDADVYGHSIPHMLGIRQKPVLVDRMIVPPVKDDLKLMSIGFFLEENEPVMWRGPMLHRALEQFLSDVHWGELDTLLAQEVASRAAVMARKTNMRLIGVVENMSGDIFGSGGGDVLAAQLEVPLLGRVPLDAEVRACGDGGRPLVTARPESETACELVRIAEAIHATKRERGVGIVKPLTLA